MFAKIKNRRTPVNSIKKAFVLFIVGGLLLPVPLVYSVIVHPIYGKIVTIKVNFNNVTITRTSTEPKNYIEIDNVSLFKKLAEKSGIVFVKYDKNESVNLITSYKGGYYVYKIKSPFIIYTSRLTVEGSTIKVEYIHDILFLAYFIMSMLLAITTITAIRKDVNNKVITYLFILLCENFALLIIESAIY